MAEAIAPAIAPNIFKLCVSVVGEHLGYIRNYKKNIANLQTQVEKLDKERDDKRHSVTVAVKNAHKIKNRVKGWQDETDKISEEAIQIIQDYEEKGKKRCLMGLCPNLVSRYRFSKRACRKEVEIVDAVREAEKIREVSDRAIGLGKEIALSTEGCFTFDSRKSILEDIVKTLQDETKNSVGVYGLGGMGKTTLAKQVASQVTKEKMFEEVVMASVTQKVDMKEIQGQIASMLDLKLEESSTAERASRIHERLKGKKVLVVLDDLWTKLDLIQVGIPFGEEHIGCKVLLTSRFGHVLSSMATRKEYDLGALKEEEAWKLFEEKVSHIVKNPQFFAVGKEVAKKCAGWPILIVTTAASLAKRPDLDAWNDTLAQVKKMNNKNMHDIVNSVIESISYECLNETHKRLFLLCGLMQGGALFEDILKYSLGWDLFGEDAILTVEGARNRLHALIFDLKESCLLLDGYGSDRIKMHDVVRDVAISIARKDLNAFSAPDVSRWPKNDVLKECTAMVFKECPQLPRFPQRLECPSLELFILLPFSMVSKPTIPDTFFERTSKIKVLDMTKLCFPTLPTTLSFLTNLQSLHLDHCDGLQDISMVGELKKLQVLSLIGSTIQELPSSLGQLSELKLLDLNRCSQLKVIPAGLVASLSQLEELHMSKSFDKWESEECLNNNGRSNARFSELKCLSNLSYLKVELRDAKLLAEDLKFENLKRYEIIVGDMWDRTFRVWFKNLKIKTIIALQLGTNSINHLQNVVDTLFKRTECLCLGELKGINNVIPELGEGGFPELKHLCIVKDYEIQYIVNVEDRQNKAFFPALESLQLSNLPKIEKICNGRLMEGSFYKLTIVNVQDCNRLESLFSFSTIIALPCLQEIQVSNCKLLKQVVARKEGETKTETIIFPQLSLIRLENLPSLTKFYSGSVEEITTRGKIETATQPLFDEKVQFPSLKTLFIKNLGRIRAISFSSTMSTTTEINLKDKLQEIPIFQNLSEVAVYKCESLKFVFPASVTRSLTQLMKICVEDCAVGTIIGDDEDIELESTTFTFPKLVTVKLKGSPNMECFYPREHIIEWPALKELDVVNCEKLYVLDLLGYPGKQRDDRIVKVISSLKRLSIRSKELSTLSGLCDLLQPRLSLEELTISEFQGELSTFPSKFLNIIHHQLQTFQVYDCSFQEIFPYEGDVIDHTTDGVLFPRLRKLVLEKLPELEGIRKQDQYSSSILNILDKLEDLRVMECPHLTSLVPPFVSFRLLKELRVLNCGGLINLLRPSTAASLEQLEFFYISGCEMIEEIIVGEVRDDEDGIIFSNLWLLSIEKLPRLTNFCSSRNYSFSFPKLTNVYVVECPNMKTFCGGTTTTPKLNKVYLTKTESKECWEGELNTTLEKIYEKREAERLAISLPSTLATNHYEAEAQEERVAGTYTSERSKEKEVEVSEHFAKSDSRRYSNPSCSPYTAPSSQLSPQITNHPDEVNHVATPVEARTLVAIVSITSSSNQFEAQAQTHYMSPEKSIMEPEKESRILKICIEELGDKESEVCESVTTRSRKETETCDQVVEMEAQGLTKTLPSTSSSGQFGQEAESHKKSIDEFGNETEVSEKTTKLRNESELCDNANVPKQVTTISPRLVTKAETENFIPLIRESFRALGAQPMSSLNAEQVQFVKDASDWLCAYAKKATKCLERNNEISDLKREIAEKESKLRALQDENEATSSSMPSFG